MVISAAVHSGLVSPLVTNFFSSQGMTPVSVPVRCCLSGVYHSLEVCARGIF